VFRVTVSHLVSLESVSRKFLCFVDRCVPTPGSLWHDKRHHRGPFTDHRKVLNDDFPQIRTKTFERAPEVVRWQVPVNQLVRYIASKTAITVGHVRSAFEWAWLAGAFSGKRRHAVTSNDVICYTVWSTAYNIPVGRQIGCVTKTTR
jgi:hypothetical protein